MTFIYDSSREVDLSYVDPIRFHQNDVIIRSQILILHVDRNVKQYSSTTVT